GGVLGPALAVERPRTLRPGRLPPVGLRHLRGPEPDPTLAVLGEVPLRVTAPCEHLLGRPFLPGEDVDVAVVAQVDAPRRIAERLLRFHLRLMPAFAVVIPDRGELPVVADPDAPLAVAQQHLLVGRDGPYRPPVAGGHVPAPGAEPRVAGLID